MKTIIQLKNTRRFKIITKKTAGLCLIGSEIKAIRNHQISINDAYILPNRNERSLNLVHVYSNEAKNLTEKELVEKL